LTSALQVVADVVAQVEAAGISAEKIVIGGFSQGACLASEFVVRNPRRYGGLLAFSGGIIGPLGMARSDSGSLDGTPVFIGCSDVDFHIPLERVEESAELFTTLGAVVNKQIYPNMGHTIIQDEIDHARALIAGVGGESEN
jgi:predicted esterase